MKPDWTIECMCVVCHAPMAVTPSRGVTPIYCRDDAGVCQATWHRMRVHGLLADKVQFKRWTHAYRREQLVIAHRMNEAFERLLGGDTARATRIQLERDAREDRTA